MSGVGLHPTPASVPSMPVQRSHAPAETPR